MSGKGNEGGELARERHEKKEHGKHHGKHGQGPRPGPDPTPPAPGSGDRLDGITKLKGSLTFSSGGTSINVTVDTGDVSNTSAYKADGADGATQPNFTNARTATRSTEQRQGQTVYVFSATNLPAAVSGEDYNAGFRYTITGGSNPGDRTLRGSVAGSQITVPGPGDPDLVKDVTLS